MIEYKLALYSSYLLSFASIFCWISFEHFVLRQNHWQNALTLLLLAIPWNLILKTLIAVPLMPPMVGFAIPSGHTHLFCVFWGYLAFAYRKHWLASMVVPVIILFSWSLVHSHYHNWLDIFVAYLVAIIDLCLYIKYFRSREYFALEALTILLLSNYFMNISYFPSYSLYGLTLIILFNKPDKCKVTWLLGLWLCCLESIVFSTKGLVELVIMTVFYFIIRYDRATN